MISVTLFSADGPGQLKAYSFPCEAAMDELL